jgi:hypothetical protein
VKIAVKTAVNTYSAGLAAIALCASAHLCAQSFTVPAELWDRPRSSATVMGRAPIRQAVNAWLAHPELRLVVHHAGGQEPLLQAEELRAWLIALAIEAERVTLRNDLKAAEPLQIEVVRD